MPVLGVSPMLRSGSYVVKLVIIRCELIHSNEGYLLIIPKPVRISLGLWGEISNDRSFSSSATSDLISSNPSNISWSKSGPGEALYRPKGEAARSAAEFLVSR